MPLSQLYPKAFEATERLRRAGRPDDANTNYHALNKAVREWRAGKLNDEQIKSNLFRIIKGEVIIPTEEGENPAS